MSVSPQPPPASDAAAAAAALQATVTPSDQDRASQTPCFARLSSYGSSGHDSAPHDGCHPPFLGNASIAGAPHISAHAPPPRCRQQPLLLPTLLRADGDTQLTVLRGARSSQSPRQTTGFIENSSSQRGRRISADSTRNFSRSYPLTARLVVFSYATKPPHLTVCALSRTPPPTP